MDDARPGTRFAPEPGGELQRGSSTGPNEAELRTQGVLYTPNLPLSSLFLLVVSPSYFRPSFLFLPSSHLMV